jgi:hypothetical protein
MRPPLHPLAAALLVALATPSIAAAQSAREACADAARALVRQQTSWEESSRSFGAPDVLYWRAWDGTRGRCRLDERGRVIEVRIDQWGREEIEVWPPGGTPSGITEERGYDREGGDFQSIRTSSLGECQAACLRDPRCLAYSFSSLQERCWLKDRVPPSRPDREKVTGVRSDPGGGPGAGSLTEEWNSDRRGGDYRDFRTDRLSLCQEACRDESRCRAYTFDPREGVCYLKDRVGPPFSISGRVTGYKP